MKSRGEMLERVVECATSRSGLGGIALAVAVDVAGGVVVVAALVAAVVAAVRGRRRRITSSPVRSRPS